MPTPTMRDLVVVLPGITGSVLTKDGHDLWAPSGEALWKYVTDLGKSLDALRLPPHAPEAPPVDGIVADRLVPDFHGVFGLGKIDGYSRLVRAIGKQFWFNNNLVSFAYDWRLSNRVNARRLRDRVQAILPILRRDEPTAGVILVAHSMGGLVAHYYLEVLEGWRDCHLFITFGTPFRGSVNALDYLANGYKELFVDFTEVMRTFPSVYELMPRYKMLRVGGSWQRIADPLPDGLNLGGLNQKMAEDGYKFHLEIDDAVARNKHEPLYNQFPFSGSPLRPIVGIRQKTLQSAELGRDGRVKANYALPENMDPAYDDGDGTVPRASATPVELSNQLLESFFAEQHASLQNNKFVLIDMLARLQQVQAKGLAQVQAADFFADGNSDAQSIDDGTLDGVPPQSWIGLEFQDVYRRDEPVEILADAQADAEILADGLEAKLQRTDRGAVTGDVLHKLQRVSPSEWKLVLGGLAPGRYRLLVGAGKKIGAPDAITAIFEVADIS